VDALHLGLICGIGPAATDYYHRRLIAQFGLRGVPLDLTIVHADSATLLANLERGDAESQVAVFAPLTQRLQAAGADCVVVTSVAGHFCIEPFKAVSRLPVIDLLQVVNAAVSARGLGRIAVLGTRTVMQTRFYGGIANAEVLAPAGTLLEQVHDAYVTMAKAGSVTADQRSVFQRASDHLFADAGVEAIMLGGTDLALVYDVDAAPFPIIDCAAVHVDAIVDAALAFDH